MIDAKSEAFPYTANGRAHVGTLLSTQDAAPRAGVIVLPDWRGQSGLAKQHARDLLEIGCDVVIVDLYGDGFNPSSPDQVGPMVQQLVAHRQEGVAALASCFEAFKKQLPGGTPVISLGYSAGGMIALDFARSGAAIAGTIICSALLKTAAEGMPTRVSAPVLILQGTQDVISTIETIAAVILEMDAAGNDARFVLFSQTHHAFDNPEAGTDPNARLVYSATSAKRARIAIRAFIGEITGGH
jgi:dienelactone hydrolase